MAAFQRQWGKLDTAQREAKDGRALFRFGPQVADGETHIIWEAIGAHAEVYNFKD